MRLVTLLFLVLTSISGFVTEPSSRTSLNYLEIGYSIIEDSQNSNNEFDGIGINFSWRFENSMLLKYERQELENSYQLPINFTYHGFGLGYAYDFDPNGSVYVIGRRKKVTAVDYEDQFDRYYDSKVKSVGIGTRYRINSQFELVGEARADSLELLDGSDESQEGGKFELVYSPTQNFSIVGAWEYVLEQDVYGVFFRFSL